MYYIQADIAFELVMHHHVAQNQIAALTPYSAQKDEIKKWLLKKNPKLSNVHVKTVTESQGNILIKSYDTLSCYWFCYNIYRQ